MAAPPDKFDPYQQWLGIPPEEQPPSHYRLLGLADFEGNARTIAQSADRAIAHVRSFETGSRAAWSERLLNELAAARACLLDARRKEAYDQSLRVKRGIQGLPHRTERPQPAAPIEAPPPLPPAAPNPQIAPPVSPVRARVAQRRARKRIRELVSFTVLVCLLAGLIAVAVIVVRR